MTRPERIVIARGRTAEVLVWQDQQVLKLFYEWVPATWVEREIRVAHLVSTTDLPTPKLLGELSVDGRRGLVFERVTGKPLLRLLATQPWLSVRYARQMAELQYAIHQQIGSGLPLLKAGLENTFRRLEGQPAGLVSAILEHLSHLPDGEALCHFDFHPEQVLVTPKGLVVLDWMTAYCGTPAADVARTTVLFRFGRSPDLGWLMARLADLLRGTFYRAYLQRYLELNPSVTLAEINAWLVPVALARLAEDIPGEKDRIEVFLKRTRIFSPFQK